MNKLKSIIRIAALWALAILAFVFLFGKEQDKATSFYMFRFIIDKGLAFLAFYFMARLYIRWSKVDPWLKAYDKWTSEGED